MNFGGDGKADESLSIGTVRENINDLNYWDRPHWRIHVGRALVDDLGVHVAHRGEFVSTVPKP